MLWWTGASIPSALLLLGAWIPWPDPGMLRVPVSHVTAAPACRAWVQETSSGTAGPICVLNGVSS